MRRSRSAAAIAASVGLSESDVVRAFKGSFGVTPSRDVLRERVARARRLLADRRLSVSEVAVLSGFPDGRMGRRFRCMIGRSPTALVRRA
ncbi:helix-turn-helix domain-containing protein [Methylobacterium sp. ID0610]|uniref:helix-turn-helix domain-containing protein n=1 Tax=Methylobacterium carpenticola TaxID=3344827 RepID=UPI0036C75A9D